MGKAERIDRPPAHDLSVNGFDVGKRRSVFERGQVPFTSMREDLLLCLFDDVRMLAEGDEGRFECSDRLEWGVT